MDPCTAQLDRIEAKLDRLVSPELPIVGVEEAMKLTGAKSRSALYDHLKFLGVQPYARGRYRRIDIVNAIGRQLYKTKSST